MCGASVAPALKRYLAGKQAISRSARHWNLVWFPSVSAVGAFSLHARTPKGLGTAYQCTPNLNQWKSPRFSKNSLNFSQYSTTEKIQWCYIDWIFAESQRLLTDSNLISASLWAIKPSHWDPLRCSKASLRRNGWKKSWHSPLHPRPFFFIHYTCWTKRISSIRWLRPYYFYIHSALKYLVPKFNFGESFTFFPLKLIKIE